MQGDVVGIVDSAGALVVEYKYDAWGKPIARSYLTTAYEALGRLNPFRYRGYVYDEETGLYYLRSRYYNPKWGRFINSDCTSGIVGRLMSHSAYVYCSNSPVDQADQEGQIGSIITGILNAIAEAATRAVINAVCALKHASKFGKFSITSVTRDNTITKKKADSHNSAVSKAVSTISFIFGAILGSYAGSSKVLAKAQKVMDTAIGGFLSDQITGPIQDVFIEAYTVRPGTYTSIKCQYERNFKVLFFPGVEVHSYELRIYPDYCEVWYSYLYNGLNSTITAPQKVGEMTLVELKEELGGQ